MTRHRRREHSIHLDLLSPRARLVEAIELTAPGIRREHIHVWTLAARAARCACGACGTSGGPWASTSSRTAGRCPSGLPAFTDSGTYAPTYLVGTWKDETGAPHLFLCDGYAASAEAMQAASLSDALDVDVSMALYSPRFERPLQDEHQPDASRSRCARLRGAAGPAPGRGSARGRDRVDYYRSCLREKSAANLPSAQARPPRGRLLPREELAGAGGHRLHRPTTPTRASPA